jgi:hypothetical protein
MSSMRSSTEQVPVPPDELTCHDNPTICVRVEVVELEGLLKPENRAVIVVGVAVGAAAIAYVGQR